MKSVRSIIAALLAFALPGHAGGDGMPVPEPARAADSLVDSIGVATHFTFRDSMYCVRWERVQELLGGLGVRHIRDGLAPLQDQLWERYGIQVIAIDDDPGVAWDQKIALWKEKRHLLTAIEGPNEVNGGWKKLNKTYLGKGWPEGPRDFQNDLHQAIKADPELKSLPVIALSTAYKGDGPKLAPLASFDYANTHSYPGGALPSASLDFRDPYLLLGRQAVVPPLVASETGYHTCLGNSTVIAGTQAGVSHAAQRKYLPRLLAEYFNAGFHWTILYEFGAGRPNKAEQEDPEAAFGLLTPEAVAKPAYFALKDLIAILGESHWDAAGRKWIRPAPFEPRALSFALRGAPDSLHHTLLQRSDGSFQLLLWNEVSSFDRKTKKDIPNKEVAVQLVLAEAAERITVSRLGAGEAPPVEYSSAAKVDLLVPDEVIVVGIKPAARRQPAPVASPADISAKSSPTSIELSWPLSSGADAWWVFLNERSLGQARPGTDGRVHFTAKGLLPAMTYPFEIVAAARDGGVSAPAKISAATDDAFPDLVVESLKTVPEHPGKGDTVRLVAVIANVGNVPTEKGTTVGTKFSVDGKVACWSDAFSGPLAPGQRLEVSPNNGPEGRTSWVVSSTNHQIRAVVDDVNRISESNEQNNTQTIPLGAAVTPSQSTGHAP